MNKTEAHKLLLKPTTSDYKAEGVKEANIQAKKVINKIFLDIHKKNEAIIKKLEKSKGEFQNKEFYDSLIIDIQNILE